MDVQITTDMEGIIDDAFFSETIEHYHADDYHADDLIETIPVIWSEPESGGINDRFDSSLPAFEMKTSDNGNIDRLNSRFIRNSKKYKIMSIFNDTTGITVIQLTEVDA